MQKLRKNDLVVKSPGLQIRERIQRDYGDLKTFAKKIEMSESSVDQYLTNKNMGSSTFKIRLTKELGQDFRLLYQSDEAQVEGLIARFQEESEHYLQLHELQMSETLLTLARAHGVGVHALADLYHGLARYREACGEPEKAMGYLCRGLSALRSAGSVDKTGAKIAELLTSLIWMERHTAAREKMDRDLQSWAVCLKYIQSNDRKSELCQKVSQAFYERADDSTAKVYLTMASDLAETPSVKGRVKLCAVLLSEDPVTCQAALEEAERLLRGEGEMISELLIARARLSEISGDPREVLNYLQMAMERCGRRMTAHGSLLSELWYKTLMAQIPDAAEYDRAIKAHVIRVTSELGKGYKHAREHLGETMVCLEKKPLSAISAFELLKDLGKILNPQGYHVSLQDSVYKLLGKLAALAFGSGLSDILLPFGEEDEEAQEASDFDQDALLS